MLPLPSCLVVAVLVATSLILPGSAVALQEDADAELRLGKGYYREGFYAEAVRHFENVTRTQHSAREEALFLLGESQRALERHGAAAESYRQLTRDYPRSEWRCSAWLGEGESWVRAERPEDAVAPLEQLIANSCAERPVGLYWLADARTRTGDAERAIAAYEDLLRSHQDHELRPFAAYQLAVLQRDAGRLDASIQAVESMLSDAPPEIRNQAHLLRGDLAQRQKDPGRAVTEYAKVGGPLSSLALSGTCWAARDLEDRDLFRRAHEQLRATGDQALIRDADLLRGAWEAESGRIAAADAALDPHRSSERSDEAWFWKAWARARAQQHTEAASMFAQVADRQTAWGSRASFHMEQELRLAESWDEALEVAGRFLQRTPADDPRCADVLAGAMESAYRLGRDDEVLQLETRYLENFADHSLRATTTRYAAEAAFRADQFGAAVQRFEWLWQRATPGAERSDIGLRLARSRFALNPEQSVEELQKLVSQLEGSTAAEVGILLGRAYQQMGDSARASAAFVAAAAADPQGEAGNRASLENAVLAGSSPAGNARAIEAYRAVLARTAAGPVRARALLDLAELLASTGQYGDAIPLFSSYLDENPTGADRPNALLGVAFAKWQTGALDEAWADWQSLQAAAVPEELQVEALYLQGRLLSERKEAQPAIAALEKFRSQYPTARRMPEVLRELAQLREEAGELAEAAEVLKTLTRDHADVPGADQSLYQFGWILHELEDAAGAEAAFRKLLAEHPQSELLGDVHYRLADFHYERKEFEQAREHYQSALESPDADRLGAQALYRIGWSFSREKNWTEAGGAFGLVADRYPDHELTGESLFLAADAAGRSDDDKREREFLERFVRAHTQHEFILEGAVRLAELWEPQRKWQEIRDLLDPIKRRELASDLRFRHRICLGRALRHLGAGESAMTLLQEVLEEGKARAAEAKFEIGMTHRALGRTQEAIDVFMSGAFLYPYRPWAVRSYLEAGRGFLSLGKTGEAQRLLARAVSEDPDGSWGAEAKKLLDGMTAEGGL